MSSDKHCETCGQPLIDWDAEEVPCSDEVVFQTAEQEWLRAPNILRRLVNSADRLKRLGEELPIDNLVNQNERGLFVTFYLQSQDWMSAVFRKVMADAATHGIMWPVSLDANHEAHSWNDEDGEDHP